MGRLRTVVASIDIGASWDLKLIAHAVFIGIHEAGTFTVKEFLGIGTCAVVAVGFGIVVAGVDVDASQCARSAAFPALVQGGACAIFLCGLRVEVARHVVRAAQDFKLVAHAIGVGVHEAVAGTIEVHLGEQTFSGIRGGWIVVAGFVLLASDDFKFIAHPVHVHIVEAGTIAAVEGFRIGTRAVVAVGFGIVVAGLAVDASQGAGPATFPALVQHCA